jgi:hypothetical protein
MGGKGIAVMQVYETIFVPYRITILVAVGILGTAYEGGMKI